MAGFFTQLASQLYIILCQSRRYNWVPTIQFLFDFFNFFLTIWSHHHHTLFTITLFYRVFLSLHHTKNSLTQSQWAPFCKQALELSLLNFLFYANFCDSIYILVLFLNAVNLFAQVFFAVMYSDLGMYNDFSLLIFKSKTLTSFFFSIV